MGTNMGDRAGNLRRALVEIRGRFKVLSVSQIYETEPAYRLDQPRFLNQCCLATTSLANLNTLSQLKQCESDLGREAGVRFGPRLIDLDLLFYDDMVVESEELTLPHPLLHERAFVLVPLNEIAPAVVHPALGVTVEELLERLPDEEKLKVWEMGGEPGTAT